VHFDFGSLVSAVATVVFSAVWFVCLLQSVLIAFCGLPLLPLSVLVR